MARDNAMEEQPAGYETQDQPPPYRPPEIQARAVLVVQLLMCMLCAGVFQLIAYAAGWQSALELSPDADPGLRWQARLELGLGHFFAFSVAGFLTLRLFYRSITGTGPDWPDYLRARRAPALTLSGLALLLMTVSIPFVLYSLQINRAIPIPDSFREAEEQAELMLGGLLIMDSPLELLANLVVIALLPAIGEELVFRGVVQQQLMRRIANPWVALAVSAAVFSFFHFQFEGFIARFILGFLLGWLFWKTQNFWIPALAHFFNNGFQVVGQYLYGKEVSAIDFEQDVEVPWFLALVSAFLVWVTMRLIAQIADRQVHTNGG